MTQTPPEADKAKVVHEPPKAQPAHWNVQPHEVLQQIRQDRPKAAPADHAAAAVVQAQTQRHLPVANVPQTPHVQRVDVAPQQLHPTAPLPRPELAAAQHPAQGVEIKPQPGNQSGFHGQQVHREAPAAVQYGQHNRSGVRPFAYGAGAGAAGMAINNYYNNRYYPDDYGSNVDLNFGVFDPTGQIYGSPYYGNGYDQNSYPIDPTNYPDDLSLPPLYGDNVDPGFYPPDRYDGYGSNPYDGYGYPPYGYERNRNPADIIGAVLPNLFTDILGGIIENASRKQYENDSY